MKYYLTFLSGFWLSKLDTLYGYHAGLAVGRWVRGVLHD